MCPAPPTNGTPQWKVGGLAKVTGLSIRTLHHYHAIELLVPSVRTPSGHRLYSLADMQRLQQIQSLRAMGLSLKEIKLLLERRSLSVRRTIELHLERVHLQIAAQQELARRLEEVARLLSYSQEAPIEELVRIIEGIRLVEPFFTTKERAELAAAGKGLGEMPTSAMDQADHHNGAKKKPAATRESRRELPAH